MNKPEFNQLLLEAIHGGDERARNKALQQLIDYAQSLIPWNARGHADSVALSAVEYVERRITAGELRFDTCQELLAYLKKVARGKCEDRNRRDRRALGVPRETDDQDDRSRFSAIPAPEPGASTIVGIAEFRAPLREWLHSFPVELRLPVADRVVDLVNQRGEDSIQVIMGEVERDALLLVDKLDRVVRMLPEALRDGAAMRIQHLEFCVIAETLDRMESRIHAARALKARDRLVVEMRESGWEPKDIAEKLNLEPGHVRVIHKRLCDKVAAGCPESDG